MSIFDKLNCLWFYFIVNFGFVFRNRFKYVYISVYKNLRV